MPTSRLLWWGGLAAAAVGAVLSVIGWYGVSGERFAERQIPYLASCTVPGAALLVAGAVLLAAAGRMAALLLLISIVAIALSYALSQRIGRRHA